jgi:antitoxin HicB
MKYPVKLEYSDGEYVAVISHPNARFQGACAGKTETEACGQLGKLIEAIIASAIKDGDDIVDPKTCHKGNRWVYVSPLIAAKAAIYTEMRRTGKRKADMVRALRMDAKQIDRILDPSHRSTLPQLEAAALSLGKHIDLRLA